MYNNNRSKLCSDRDETINRKISEGSKLVQNEYKTRHDWMGKVIYWELCKTFKFGFTHKWYMSESVQEHKTHKILWDFEIQTDHLISAKRPALVIVNKKQRTCWIVDFAVPADLRVKLKESEKWDKYLDFARELKTREHESDNYNWCDRYSCQRISTGTGGLENKRTSGDHQRVALLRSARILRRVLESCRDWRSLRLQWRTIS